MLYKDQRNYENITKALFKGVGEYGMPEIKPTQYIGFERPWVGFNYAPKIEKRSGKGVHFFLDDYQFLRLWNMPDKYISMLQGFDYVMSPDFSLFTDFPKVLQLYNHYRKHWLGAYMQHKGIQVIPTISWSDDSSYDWCFCGEPKNSAVAVSSVGCMSNRRSQDLFLQGYMEMLERLTPSQVLFYGTVPDECKQTSNIIKIPEFQRKFAKAGGSYGRTREL